MSRGDWTSDTAEDKIDVAAEARRRGIEPYQVRAIGAVDDKLMRDIVNDSRRNSMIPAQRSSDPGPATKSRNGWVDAAPLAQPAGLRVIDQLCDAADRQDRVAAIRQRVEAAWAEAHFQKGPRVARSHDPFQGFDDDVPSCHREKK